NALGESGDLDGSLAQQRIFEERVHHPLLEPGEVDGRAEQRAAPPPGEPPPRGQAGERPGGDHPTVVCESGWPLPQHPLPTLLWTPLLGGVQVADQGRRATWRRRRPYRAAYRSPGWRLLLPALP